MPPAVRASARRLSTIVPAPLLPLLALVTALLLIYAVLFPAWSADMASYLMTRNWVLGVDQTGLLPFHYRPPLLGVFLVPFTAVLGDLWGSKILAILSVLTFSVAAYHLARVWYDSIGATIAATIAVLSPLTFDLITGGYGSFLSVAAGLVIIRRFILAKEGRRSDWWVMPLMAFLMVGINQTVPPLIAICIVLLPSYWTRRGILLLAVSVLATAPWWPFVMLNFLQEGLYYGVQRGWLEIRYPRIWASALPYAYVMLMTFLTLGVIMVKGWRATMLPFLVFALAVGLVHQNIAINNLLGRTQIVVSLFFGLSVAGAVLWAWDSLRMRHRAIAAAWPIVVLGMALVAFQAGHATAKSLNVLTPNLQRGITWVEGHTGPEDVIITHPHGVGWWMSGMTGRAWAATWPVEAPIYYQPEWADVRCAMGWSACPPETPSIADYVLVDWSLTPMDSPTLRALTEGQTPEALTLLWQSGEAQIYRVNRPRIERTPTHGRMWPWERTGKINR